MHRIRGPGAAAAAATRLSGLGSARPAVLVLEALLPDVTPRRVACPGGDLAVFEQGRPTGPTVVLVHGWPDTHRLWDRVAGLLADRYRVLSYDMRGFGDSFPVAGVSDLRIEALAADFHAVIDALSPDAPVHVLAHDWGACTLWEVVSDPRSPRRILSHTSVSGPNFDLIGPWFRSRVWRPTPGNLARVAGQCLASSYALFFHLPVLPTLLLRGVLCKVWPRFVGLFDGLDPALVWPAPTLASDMVVGTKLYRANIFRKLARPAPRPVGVPTQLLLNMRDRAVLPYIYADYRQWVHPLETHRLDAGHWSPLSHAAEVAAHFDDFAGRHDTPGREAR
jgi:pimeloyl-ACP methyl ester carboxylesterase